MAAWLDLVPSAEGWSLADTGRFTELIHALNFPRDQYPSMIYFAGNGSRLAALRALFPHNNVMRRGPSGLARLHISTSTAHTTNPTLFAEGNPFTTNGLGDTAHMRNAAECHQRYPIGGDRTKSLAIIQREAIRQYILPWTQIVCLFVGSRSEMQAARDLLHTPAPQTWMVGHQAIPELMHVIVVLTRHNDDEGWSAEAHIRKMLPQHHITVFDLQKRDGLSGVTTFEPLRCLLLSEIEAVHEARRTQHLLFSAFHLAALWDTSLKLQEGSGRPKQSVLDCLSIARGWDVDVSRPDCLAEFLHHVAVTPCPPGEKEEFVASALLMDAYPPGMHNFRPDLVFDALYSADCHRGWMGDSRQHVAGIRDYFVRGFVTLGSHQSSAAARQHKIAEFFRRWGGLHSIRACLLCLCRQPEHVMPCQHTICDRCVVIFGQQRPSAEYHTRLYQCPICGEQFDLTIRRLPPTKGPVIFSLDGGGVRGIIQLGLLRALEKRLHGMSIADLPDLCMGTSVGALSEVDLFFNNASATESFDKFLVFARKIFKPTTEQARASPLLRGLHRVKCIFRMFSSGRYDTDNLEDTLKQVAAPHRRMFDAPANNVTGCRVAIITSRTVDGKACVIANYRGLGHRDANGSYLFLAPQSQRENPYVWEAARCSVAAPFFFSTKSLPGLGTLQDGGVRANNPLAIALRESRVIWPSVKRHDVLLSVGTGYSSAPVEKSTHGPAEALREGSLARMIRATLCSPCLDGPQAFQEALNYVPDPHKPDILRLDTALSGPLPRLDDVDRLAKLSDLPFTVPDELLRTLLATAFFFFELDATPVKAQGRYYCRGSVLCSRKPTSAVLESIRAEIPGAAFHTDQGAHLGLVDSHDGCYRCGYYRKKVAFSLRSLEETFSIEICNDMSRHRIGGFPKSVRQLTDEQQVYAWFGRADHLDPVWPPQRSCYCGERPKRKIRFAEPGFGHKKRRL